MSQVILITGASSGIGKICAEHLADNGFIVYGTSRKEMSGKKSFHPLQMDVTDMESIKKGVSGIINDQGKIDIVINNAGVGIAGALELATMDEARLQMETNFMGTANVCSAVIPYLKQRPDAKIINISSVGGIMGIPFQGLYSASKFAVEGYSETLRMELNQFGIKVVLIEPGDFNTGFTYNRRLSEKTIIHPDYKDAFNRAIEIINEDELNGADPERIARLVRKIIMKKNPGFRYVTGHLSQVLLAYLKKIMPVNWYQSIMRSHYQINGH